MSWLIILIVLQVVVIVFKLFKKVLWSWWIVLIPLWCYLASVIFEALIGYLRGVLTICL